MAINETTIGLEDTQGLFMNPMDFFDTLPGDVQAWIVWILSFLAFIFLIVTLISFFGHGIGASTSSLQKDGAGRGHHTMGIISGIFTLILVIVALALTIGLYT